MVHFNLIKPSYLRWPEKSFTTGYNYAKKESRSKYFGAVSNAAKPKRRYTSKSICSSRIQDIQESITSITDTIKLLTQQKQLCVNTEKFLQAAEINTTTLEKSKAKRDIERELADFSKANKRSRLPCGKEKETQEFSRIFKWSIFVERARSEKQ